MKTSLQSFPEVLRRLGRDTAIQWHHWGSENKIDPKATSFLNFATMASYSCILARNMKKLDNFDTKMQVVHWNCVIDVCNLCYLSI